MAEDKMADKWLDRFPKVRSYASQAARRHHGNVEHIVRDVAKTFYIQEFDDPGITQRVEDGLSKAENQAHFAESSDNRFLRNAINSNLERSLSNPKAVSLAAITDLRAGTYPSSENEVDRAESLRSS